MSFSRRLLLVGTDHRLSQMIQTHLHKTFLLTAPVVRFEDLSNFVSRDTDGVLLFLAGERADVEKINAVVRSLRLQQYPTRMALLETSDFFPRESHDLFEGRFRWPDQMKELNASIRRIVTPGTPFVDPTTETLEETITRRLLAHTPSLAPMVRQLQIAAAHDVTVLIEGETGTGKTHLARLIHECSSRNPHRFLVVPCGALSANLIASEFFGHEKGAFTGADATKIGKFAAAGQGTILLDEIDTLSLEHQANLLRVIETGEFEPVGSTQTQQCEARIVVATNWNLSEAVERGTFRRDLYYRLQVITFHLPALRSRPQDIPPLVRGMIARYSSRFGKQIVAIHPEAIRALEEFSWPGNIRQLENVVQQSVLSCPGDMLLLSHLPAVVQPRGEGRTDQTPYPGPNSLAQNRESAERMAIIKALEKVGQSRTRAAELLGISRVTLYKKMDKYGLLTKRGLAPPSDLNGFHFAVE